MNRIQKLNNTYNVLKVQAKSMNEYVIGEICVKCRHEYEDLEKVKRGIFLIKICYN